MLEQNIIAVTITLTSAIMLYSVVRVGIFDIIQSKRENIIKKSKTKVSKNPLISIVIETSNNESGIIVTIESIYHSSINKFEVVIIDNKSKDSTVHSVRSYMRKNHKKNLTLVAKRKYSKNLTLYDKSIKKHIKGDFVFVMKAGQTVEKDSLKNTRNYLLKNDGTIGLLPHISYRFYPSIKSLVTTLYDLCFSRNLKMSKTIIIPSSLNRNYALKLNPKKSDRNTKLIYTPDILVNAPINTTTKNVVGSLNPIYTGTVRTVFNILVVVIIAYGFISSNQILFLIGWLVATIDYTFLITGDSNIKKSEKFRLFIYIPIMYIYGLGQTIFLILNWTKNIKRGSSILLKPLVLRNRESV